MYKQWKANNAKTVFDSSVPKAFLPSYTVMDDLHKNLVSQRKQTSGAFSFMLAYKIMIT